MFKPKEHHVRQSQVEKFTRYSIRKVSFGAASVAVATGLFFLGGGSVQAAEQLTNSEPTEVQNSQNLTDKSSEPSKEVTGQESATDKTSDGQKTTSVKESATDTQASAVETPNVVTEKVAINTTSLEDLVAKVESRLSQLTEGKKTKSVIDDAKNLVNKAKELLNDDTKTQEKVDAQAKQLSSSIVILNSIKSETTEEKETKNQDPRNGQAIPGKGESGFRADTTVNPIIPAKEGPTNNNKLGSGNNPADGVFESAKNQFGDIDFSNATEKNREVRKQWSRSTASQGGQTEILGSLTYNWKEKEITADDANNHNALNGWKIEGGEKVTAIKPEIPTNVSSNRPAGFDPSPSKIYDLNGVIPQRDNEVPVPGNPLGVNAANQNYANGVNHSGVVGTHNLPKGYYLELGKKGTKISKEYPVNGNSRVLLSAITGGAYGNAGTAGTGERVKITVYDAATGEKISSIRDDRTIGEKMESEHISTPTGSGGNGDGWTEYRAIYEIPKTTTRVKVEIEALNDGTAINNSYLQNSNSTISDGYFVGAVNLALGTGTEMTTNVKSNRQEGKYGEDSLYKSKQTGEFEFTVNSVGGIRLYGSAETEIEIPEGVELPDNIKNPTGWVWFGDTPIAPQNIAWDPATRKLRIKYNSSKSNNGDSPYIGVGSNNGQNDGVRKFRVPFTTADNYRGTATFKVKTFLPNGLNDAQNNKILNTGDVSNANGIYHPVVDGLRNTDNPDYYYNKTIYIDTVKPVAPTVEPVHTDSINGEKTDKNQVKELLVSLPTEKNTELTNEERERKDIADNDANNGTNRNADTEVKNIERAIGGLTSLKVTLPNTKTPITLTKKADGWYNGATKVEVRDGKLVVPVPAGTDLTEANETTNPDKRIKVTVLDKAGNESDPAYANVLNEAPTVAVEKKDLYVYKTKEADKWNNATVLEKAKPSATDLEDDRDGVESTKPTIAVSDAGNLDTTTVGDYTVKVQSTDSEGKKSTEANVTVHVLDLITVDPTVTTDPTNPSTTSPVSPKTADTPVKEGDENLGKYPAGVTREDLVKEVTRTIKYLKEEDANKDNATPLYAEKVQKVTYKRTATVNPETKEVTYSDWEVYNEADKLTDAKADGTNGKYNSVESPVINNYLLVDNADKLVPEKDAPKPAQNGTATSEVKKVLYKEIGSFVPNYPAGKKPQGAPDKISYPNNPNDPTVPGDFSTITIPYVPGYTPVYDGQELTPKNPNDPTQGYKVPDGFTPTDKFGESPITYTPSTQTAKVVIEKKVDGAANEVVSSFDLTGKSGSELPANTDIDNKIKELKNQGYEVESDGYHTEENHHPTFDDQEDVNPTDGSSAPSQTFKIVVKPRIIEVPSSTPHEKDSPVDPNGDTPELKWPEGLAESDLNTTAKRVISYVKKDSDTAAEEKAKDDTVQTAPFTRKATVNLVTKEVTYTDWESPNKTWDKVGVDVLPGYIADKKEIPAKEAATPAKDTKVIPDETDKVTYTKIGSWIPVDPTTGTDGDPIQYPNDPNDPTKTGEITQVIPHKDGYTPKDGNGTPLEPVNPANPEEGYKPPKITDPKANIKITYDKDDQKAKVKFVSIDPKTQTETELTDHALTLTGKSSETIPESDVQTHIDVLKSMGYDVIDNPFDKDPVFDTKKDTNDNITQEFTVKVQPRVSTANPVYVVEGDKPSAEKLKDAVTTKGNEKTVDETKIPETTGKVGDKTLTAPVTVTYGSGDQKREETVTVPVTVLPKVTPEGVKVLKDSTGLEEVVKAKATEAATATTKLPDGVTVRVKEVKAGTVPATTATGVQTPATAVVEYVKDGKVVASKEVEVPVTVVGSTPSNIVVFEGEKPTAEQAKTAVTPGTDGTKGEPTTLPETAGKAGATDVKVDVPVTYDNGKLTETVSVPVTVLPKPEADEILVPKNGDKEKAKEKILAQAEKAIADGTFTGKLPQGATVTVDNTVPVTIPELTDDTEVEVTVKYTVPGQDKPLTTTVKVPVTVVESVPQIVPVDENNKQPDPEKSIDKTDYPEGSTFRYKTPEGQTSPIDVTTTGDKNVVVEVLDPQGNTIVEVPATVRVVGSTPQFVVADSTKKQPEVKDSITPGDYPEGTTFEYKTPVDTTTAGEKDVTVVAKLNGQPIAEVPAKVVVVDPKTQYVVADPSKPQPDASKSIDPEQYPDGTTFEYKTPVDTTTPGEKDVVVVAKDGEDKLVEVPTKVKVVQGNPQIVPVDEGKKQPDPEDSIDPNDYPDDATFEYKEEVDTSTPGDKKVTVVVKQGDKVLVEVPSTVRVVESYPKYVPVDPAKKQPDPKENINPNDFPTGTTFEYKDNTPVDTTTPGEKDVTVVAKLNGQPITEIPAKIVVVEPKTQYVPVNAEGDKKPKPQDSITPDDYPEGSTFEYKTPEGQTTPYDGTTPGEKDVTVVVKDPDGDTIVEVPAKIKVVQGKEQLTPVNAEDKDKPKAEDSITPSDYPEGSTFEYKVPEGQTTPYDGTTPGDKPVTVVVKDKDGKVLVEVPATIKVVETKPTPIETPVTNTPLTEDDYTKGMKIPEGATVKVGDLPDLTTPGEKTPVKVTITLPNGKSYTVDVPVTVTPVKEIETPVTTTPLTPEDYTKGIKIPEGGKVTNVANIPDLTTPGKKDPVRVTVTLPNGKVVTVDVPVNVTPVKEIETPVTTTPLTPDDYTKGITIPEGGKVTKVENIPDLTTPGKKDPVKVTITLPNGKVVTVEVPVNVTPITPIETPVTKDKLTPEDILKQIKVPEGATVKVGSIPELTTPGKKDPVKVTITLPNGKVVTVEVPVNVTPIKDIVKKQGDPITEEDVENHIPKGAKVISIGDKPTTDVPGERPSIPVVIELPNGIRVTVNIPVIVTPKVTPVVVQVGTPVTPEDVKKHIELPKGWKVTKVGEIPTTETPGAKPVVPVEVELPDGRKITVDVPVIVTPTVRQIVVPQGTPITPDDVKGHIDLPKEPGWEIVGVGEIPTTIPAGVKPSVKVKVKVPTGEIIEVDVPVIVTPKVTPIVVEVGTPITEEDVKKKVDLPEGWEIVEVGEIPTTETPGAKPVVKVKVKLPDGRMITVDVPVTVTPKDTPVKPTIKTKPIVVAVGDPVTKEDVELHIDLPKGAEIVEIGEIPTTETPGEKPSVKVKVKLPSGEIVEVDVPVTVTPKDTPTPRPEKPSTTEVKESKDDSKVLPNTGTKGNASLLGLGILGALSGFGLLGRKKKED